MVRLTAAFPAGGTLLFASQERRPVVLVITGGMVVTTMRDRRVLTLNEAVLQEARILAARIRAAVGH